MSLADHSSDAQETWDAIVVGAGAAGLMAAAAAARAGRRTLLLEKNRKPGVKILMSGGTRCNITQATDNRGIVEAFGPHGRFLHSALATLGVAETIELFHEEGVATKVEPTGKVFPASDKATDVLAALVRRLERTSAVLALDEPVLEIGRHGEGFRVATPRRVALTHKLLITTGGQSYPGCGTIGEGYRWAAQLGHTIVAPRPALVPITTRTSWVRDLGGITIPDVAVRLLDPGASDHAASTRPTKTRPLAERRGSLLFAHFGLSGPVILDISGTVSGHPQPGRLVIECDFLPDMRREQFMAALAEQSRSAGKKQLGNVVAAYLPRRLCDALLATARLSPETRMAELGHRGAGDVADVFKKAQISVEGTMGFKKAEVTAGGIALGEVDSSTMQSKLVPNLYLAGEVLDLDGPIGGYNFQAAWSTGTLAGLNL